MNKNQIVTLEITDITSEGNGVGRSDGMAVFVPETAVGDIIEVRIVKVLKNYAYGKVEKIVIPSADRIEPDCEYFPKCGGCSYRHISYESELKIKEKLVYDAFTRIGGISAEFLPILGCDLSDKYRNKAQYPVGTDNNRPVCGFYAKRSHRIIAGNKCRLLPDIFSCIVKDIMNYILQNNIKSYDENTKRGLLRHIFIRQGYHTKELMVCFVVTKASAVKFSELCKILSEKYHDIKSIVMNINPDNTNVILGKKTVTLWGKNKIQDIMCGNNISIAPEAFYQINTDQAEKLYAVAESFADLKGNEILLDLYCGAGTIGLSMAEKVRKLIGVEIIPQAVENARENALSSGILNAEFICSDSGKAAIKLIESGITPNIIILDPPRKGCDKLTLNAVLQINPEKIVMVSCNPATAARDCSYLSHNGYNVEKIQAVDLFPRTVHVETVVLLSREFASAKDHVYIDYEPNSDMEFPASATYTDIKAWIQKEYGLKVSSLYVAQVKQKHGIIEHECYNKPKSENSRQPKCPPEKEKAIEAALKHFKMI